MPALYAQEQLQSNCSCWGRFGRNLFYLLFFWIIFFISRNGALSMARILGVNNFGKKQVTPDRAKFAVQLPCGLSGTNCLSPAFLLVLARGFGRGKHNVVFSDWQGLLTPCSWPGVWWNQAEQDTNVEVARLELPPLCQIFAPEVP